MKSVLRIVGLGLVLVGSAWSARAADVPLNGEPAESFGPGHLNVIVNGAGLDTQPATFSVGIPAEATVVAAYLYINGRGVGDENVVVNGMAVVAPLVAQSDPLPVEDCQRIETRRITLTGGLALSHGPNAFTVEGYEQCGPGGAFVVAVVSQPSAPMRTVTIVEGADYGFNAFAPPFGPNTDVGVIGFSPIVGSRVGHAFLFLHDAVGEKADALWTLTAASATTPIPASLVGGAGGATLFEIDRLGVPTSLGGFGYGARLDIVSTDVAVPSGADYFAFQAESPAGGNSDGIGMSVAVLVLPTDADSGPSGPGGGGDDVCGDGTIQGLEECDDGNLAGGDGCAATCEVEDHAKTIDAIIRVRKHRRERIWYYTQLPGLASDLVGSAPVHVTLLANGHPILDLEVPVKAFQRVEPRATTSMPTGKFASAAQGSIGDSRLRYMRLWPASAYPTYNLKFKVKREFLKRPGGINLLTAIIRVGDQTFTTTDAMIVRRKGKIVRNAGN
jgi:cysteine-rich repeat protein